jgi:hypothetical protein
MVTITFPSREIEKRALGHLLGRFSGLVLGTGEHLVPEAALESLADQGIPFTVNGKASDEQQFAALKAKLERGAAEAERGDLIDGKEVFKEIRQMSANRRKGSR